MTSVLNQLHAYCYKDTRRGNIEASDCVASYRASNLIRFAHISKNSMVWLPGRGTDVLSTPPVESVDDASEDAREPSVALAECTRLDVTGPSVVSSFLTVVR